MRDGAFTIEGLCERGVEALNTAHGDGCVVLDDAAGFKHGDGGFKGLCVFSKEDDAGGFAVKTVDGLDVGVVLLDAKDVFGGVFTLREDACGFVDGEVPVILPEDADVGALVEGFVLARACAVLNDKGDFVSRLEGVAGDPDDLAVDPDDAGVDHGLGGTLGGFEACREEVLEGDAFFVTGDDGKFGFCK